ncbi:zinc ribbon domain-containing protein [Microseira sp. BLCC-F43]|jgi:putative transposase|uniref:zinc ribbon domain-containing protein n=1 Tax=Microseira sp. BLCC-F43 TaxID=3153602 RepID=UPI0035BB6AF8
MSAKVSCPVQRGGERGDPLSSPDSGENSEREVDARGTSVECPECGGQVNKHLSVRVHNCPHCGYITDRDVAAGQNIRNRGIKLVSTAGLAGKETACAGDLPGIEATQSRQVPQSQKRATTKSKL